MDQEKSNFKIIEIDGEEADFTGGSESGRSFTDVINDVLREESWLQSESSVQDEAEAPEETTPSEDLPEEAFEEELIEEPDEIEDDAVPDMRMDRPAKRTETDISEISDTLARVMGFTAKASDEKEPMPEAETELTIEKEVKEEPVAESYDAPSLSFETEEEPIPEAESPVEEETAPEEEAAPEPETKDRPAVLTGAADDEFYRYFGDLKLGHSSVPASAESLLSQRCTA